MLISKDNHTTSYLLAVFALLAAAAIYFGVVLPQANLLSYKGADFSTLVKTQDNHLTAKFESGSSSITFKMTDKEAKKTGKGSFRLSENTVIEYQIIKEGPSRGLKETIILENSSAPNEFAFNLILNDIGSFQPNPSDDSWRFYNNQGKEVFFIPAGFMVDAEGAKSQAVTIGITKEGSNHLLKVTADQDWLSDPARSYPIKIDPSVVVSTGIVEADAQFGDMQRKIVYVNANWYAFYTDAGDVWYKKSADGSSWGSAVEVDTEASGTDNFNPSVWLEGNLIYVAWIDDGLSGADTADSIQVNTINTASSDALGTKCTSADQGTIDTTSFMVSTTVADNGTVYLAYSDTSTDTEAAVFKLTYSGCSFSDITTGSSLTSSDRPVLVTTGNRLNMVFQDGDLSHSIYSGSVWAIANTAVAAVTDAAYSVTTNGSDLWVLTVSGTTATNFYKIVGANTIIDIDTDITSQGFPAIFCLSSDDCKLIYFDDTDDDVTYVDCTDSECSNPGITDIDGSVSLGSLGDPHCITTDDCKIIYHDNSIDDVFFLNCNDVACSAPTTSTLDTSNGDFGKPRIFCPTADDCKVAIMDSTDDDIHFIDCPNVDCSGGTTCDAGVEVNCVEIDGDVSASTSAAVNLYCPTADDCKLIFYDPTDQHMTFVDCNNASCSSFTTTDIDTSVGTASSAPSIYCPTAADCKIVYADDTTVNQDIIYFADCNDGDCDAPTINSIDANAGDTNSPAIYCPSANNCKLSYVDQIDLDIRFVDCNDGDCDAPTITDIDTDTGASGRTSMECPAANDCKIFYMDDTEDDMTFIDCNNESCSLTYSISSLTAPWTGQTNLTSVALTYDSGGNKLYAGVITDSSEQAYWKSTPTGSISWSGQSSFGFTAGDLGHLSMPLTITQSSLLDGLLRQGSNLEFSGTQTGPGNRTTVRGKSTFKGKINFR